MQSISCAHAPNASAKVAEAHDEMTEEGQSSTDLAAMGSDALHLRKDLGEGLHIMMGHDLAEDDLLALHLNVLPHSRNKRFCLFNWIDSIDFDINFL